MGIERDPTYFGTKSKKTTSLDDGSALFGLGSAEFEVFTNTGEIPIVGAPVVDDFVAEAASRAVASTVQVESVELSEAQQAALDRETTEAYDAASAKVEKLVDEGVTDEKDAWGRVDPTGRIRHRYEQIEVRDQIAINHAAAQAGRDAKLADKLREIDEKIYTFPEEREKAKNVVLAEWRVAEANRGKRA